jgi:hypothetical protein
MKEIVLPEFQEYLRANSLVQEKYIPFYAHWARKSINYKLQSSIIDKTKPY